MSLRTFLQGAPPRSNPHAGGGYEVQFAHGEDPGRWIPVRRWSDADVARDDAMAPVREGGPFDEGDLRRVVGPGGETCRFVHRRGQWIPAR